MIIQIGIFPPPIGGVSMFNKRFKEYLDSKNIKNELWDTTGCIKDLPGIKNIPILKVPFRLLTMFRKKIVHYHIPGIFPKTYIGYFNRFLFRKQIKVLTQHGNCKHLFEQDEKLMIKTLNSFDYIICVKKNDKKFLQEKGVTTKVTEIPAYIAPKINQNEIDQIPKFIWQFMEKHSPVISMNATAIKFMNGKEVYGVKRSVNLIKELKNNYPDIGLVISMPEIRDEQYFIKLQNEISENQLADNILFINGLFSFYPILLKSDLFLRPTSTDGDAVSIREALHFRVPVLASDAVERPIGTELYDFNSELELLETSKMILNDLKLYKEKLSDLIEEDNALKNLSVYNELMNLDEVVNVVKSNL